MSFIRSTALRASSVARAARPAIRAAQPLRQSIQRRTYASGHGHSEAKSSDVPWIAAAVAGTAGGLYIVVTQDFGHGDGAHDAHDENARAVKHDNSAEPEEGSDQTNPDAPKVEKDDANEEDLHKDDSEKSDGGQGDDSKHSESREVAAENKKKEHKESKAETSQEKVDDEPAASPDKSDKPSPRKEPKSANEMSGKQEGLSNSDTHHSTDISGSSEKSKKGEGVAETAKLKGTVSVDRPPTENKEERGKTSVDKDA